MLRRDRRGLAIGAAAVPAVLLGACGAVGDPLPPLLNLPSPASDLTARQVGHIIEFEWTWPLLTTEGTIAREIGGFTLWALDVPDLKNALTPETINRYRRPVATLDTADIASHEPGSRLRFQSPLSDWQLDQPVVVVVTGMNRAGRDAGHSNQARLRPLEPPAKPQGVRVEPVPDGVALSWEPADWADEYSVERSEGQRGTYDALGRLSITSFLDRGAVRDRTYRYRLRPYRASDAGWVEGPPSSAAEITLKDLFAPTPPRGLRAVRSRSSVELSWLPNPEGDLLGYRLLRDGAELSGPVTATTFSDGSAAPDADYEYALTAIDTSGNESKACPPVRVLRSHALVD